MSTTHPLHHESWSPPVSRDRGPELGDYLSDRCLPATRDELQALLVQRHAPSRVLWELAGLPENRRYADLEQLYAALEAATAPTLPREPY